MNPGSFSQKQEEQESGKFSIVKQQEIAASADVKLRIEKIQKENSIGTLEAAKLVYEEVKGHEYRKEKAIAKLLEYLNMQNELGLRGEELEEIGLGEFVGKKAVNDDKFLVEKTA